MEPEEGNHLRVSTGMFEREAEERRAGWTGEVEAQPSGRKSIERGGYWVSMTLAEHLDEV